MKKLFTLTAITFLLSISTSVAKDVGGDIVVKVDGMVCDVCITSLKKKLNKEQSIDNISAHLDSQTITINLKEDMDLSDNKIKEIIEWGGYDLLHITRQTDSFRQ